ncbi:MAG: MotA/TolQ/ExbB proton channel family protein [Planctomycetota bacterium]
MNDRYVRRNWLLGLAFLACLILVTCPRGNVARAQEEASEKVEPEAPSAGEEGTIQTNSAEDSTSTAVWEMVKASGWIGAVIVLLSVTALSLVIEDLIVIRRKSLIPPGLAQDLHAHVSAGEYALAQNACKLRPSYLSYVVAAGLREVKIGYESVEKAMENASQEQAARLFRKVEYLALIGNISPMLGLLGTVYGILLAFKKVAESQGAALAADLADGVYLALVTTVQGLIVAIPTLSAYAIFRSRIEQFASEVNLKAESIFADYKHGRKARAAGDKESQGPLPAEDFE